MYQLLDSNIRSGRAGRYCLDEIQKRAKLTSGNFLSNFQANNLKGKIITLEQFKNKYVLLDFWASWCVPCREEIPKLKRADTQYRSQGLEIIAISLDRDLDSWKKAIQKDQTYNWVHVLKNKEMNLIFEPILIIPQKILLDKAGKIIWSSLDENTVDWQEVLVSHLKLTSMVTFGRNKDQKENLPK
jgi:thiol-disulfide isomerase/thioredoxin